MTGMTCVVWLLVLSNICLSFAQVFHGFVDTAPGKFPPPPALPPPERQARVGVLLNIQPEESSIFDYGWRQTVFNIQTSLVNGGRHSAWIINTGEGAAENVPQDWLLQSDSVLGLDEAISRGIDVVIDVDGKATQQTIDKLKQANIKVVAYIHTNMMYDSMERYLYPNLPPSGAFLNTGYDQVWLPSFYNSTGAFYDIAFDAPVKTAPFVWTPRFFEASVSVLPARRYYEPTAHERRLAMLDNNKHLTRNCLVGMEAFELLYRNNPTAATAVYVTNADRIRDRPEFKSFVVETMRSYNDKIMSFEGRFEGPQFLSRFVDVVFSNHLTNHTSLLLLEALYAGYPLVHSSQVIKDCGYYYDDADADRASQLIYEALVNHQLHAHAYNKKAAQCVWRFAATNPENVYAFDRLLAELLQ